MTRALLLCLGLLTCSACLYDFDQYRPPSSNLDYTKSWDMQANAPIDMPQDISKDIPQDVPLDMPTQEDMVVQMDMQDMPDTPVEMDMSDMLDMPDLSVDMPPPDTCGNDQVDDNETCDGNCPDTCDDQDACTVNTLNGSPTTCNAVCDYSEAVTSCTHDDGCCPSGCDITNDNDCSVDCTDDASWPAAWALRESQMFDRINATRDVSRACGTFNAPRAASLRQDPKVTTAARCHALDMAQKVYLDPNSPPPENKTPLKRLQDNNFSASSAFFLVSDQDMQDLIVNQWLSQQLPCFIIMGSNLTHGAVGYASLPGAPHRFAVMSATASN